MEDAEGPFLEMPQNLKAFLRGSRVAMACTCGRGFSQLPRSSMRQRLPNGLPLGISKNILKATGNTVSQ